MVLFILTPVCFGGIETTEQQKTGKHHYPRTPTAETDRERPQLRSGELQKLMERIRSTEPHFVRCIKPNQKNVAGSFERKSVVQQLQYQGVLQAIEVSRVGFPVRLKHRQAVTSIF